MATSQPSTRNRDGSGRLAAVLGLLVLVAAGFAVGMVAGVVWEDPDLVFAYLTGATEEVAWNEGAGDAETPPVAAAAPEVEEAPADPQVRREQERAEVAAAPTPVASAPVGRVAVQVGAFESSRSAERLADSLRDKGFPVYVSPGTAAGKARWRVRVGPIATREKAEGTAERLKKVEKLPTWILDEDAP